MVATDRVRDLFADARDLQADALEMLAQGRIRNAAEKAWGSTKRATDALVLARTGDEPELSAETGSGIRQLPTEDPAIREARLVARYYTRQGVPPRSLLLHRAVRSPWRGHGAPDPLDVRLHRGCPAPR